MLHHPKEAVSEGRRKLVALPLRRLRRGPRELQFLLKRRSIGFNAV
jgi:hypothetical protein